MARDLEHFHSDPADDAKAAMEPRESCDQCGEWLQPGQTQRDCENCAANAEPGDAHYEPSPEPSNEFANDGERW